MFIYRFSKDGSDGNASMKDLLGGKGANLAEMASMGLPVPPGFTITTECCKAYRAIKTEPEREAYVSALFEECQAHLTWLEEQFGYMPLLSVRSGAPISMPGMMDTILNVGLHNDNFYEWCKRIGHRTTHDSDRRLTQMLGSVAYGVPHEVFEFQLAKIKKEAGVKLDSELDTVGLSNVIGAYRKAFEENKGFKFPFDDPGEQLKVAIRAVFDSWMSPRAVEYRKINGISEEMGTAVTVQAMVFGNMNDASGTGVLFTRNPLTGENEVFGEFLRNAQGEDVVAGIRTPQDFHDMGELGDTDEMTTLWAGVYEEIQYVCAKLEDHYKDMLDIEFTVQDGELFMLQCRTGKRAALAAFRIAVELVAEDVISRKEALLRLSVKEYKMVSRPMVDPSFKTTPTATGIAGCPGVAKGVPVFSSDAAVNATEPVILITQDTCPDDIGGMNAAVGILTANGGTTSHAAVVARAMNKPCVVGCTDLEFQVNAGPSSPGDVLFGFNGKQAPSDATVTIDGGTGRIWVGVDVPVVDGSQDPAVMTVRRWALALADVDVQGPSPDGYDGRVCIDFHDVWGDLNAAKKILKSVSDPNRLTIDMTPPPSIGAPEDEELLHAFGAPALKQQTQASNKFSKAVLGALMGSTDLKGACLTLPPGADPAPFREKGFKVASVASNVKEVLDSDFVEIEPKVIEAVFGGQEGLSMLLEMAKKSGKQIQPARRSAPVDYAVFTVLGG